MSKINLYLGKTTDFFNTVVYKTTLHKLSSHFREAF